VWSGGLPSGRASAGSSGSSIAAVMRLPTGIVLVDLEEIGRQIADALAARPDEERPWRRCAGRST
jgi:hypothetical protein